MGQDFCCIDIFIFQIADKRPDFNPLVMTVIYIIQACQVGNVSIVVIQIKPGRREYIDSSGIGKDRGNRVICRLVCDLMPGHTDIVIFLYMCKGIRSEIAFSCFFFDGGKHTFLHVSDNTVVCHYFVPVVALFDHGDFLFGRNFFQNRAFFLAVAVWYFPHWLVIMIRWGSFTCLYLKSEYSFTKSRSIYAVSEFMVTILRP